MEPASTQWATPNTVDLPVEDGGYEPGVEFADDGTMFVHAHRAHVVAEGTMLASWFLYSRDNGTTWSPVPSTANVRESRQNLEGDVAFDDAGHVFFVEVGERGLTVSQWTLVEGEPVHDRTLPVTTAVSYGDRPWVEGYGDGGLYLLAKTPFAPDPADPSEMAMVQFFRSEDGGLTWESPHAFRDSDFCDLALDPRDDAHVVVGCVHQGNIVTSTISQTWASVHESFDGGSSWTETRVVDTEDTTRRFPSIDIDVQGTVAFAFTLGDPTDTAADLMLAFGQDGEFQAISLTNGTPAERPWVSIHDGRVLVTASVRGWQGGAAWHAWAWSGDAGRLRPTLLDPTAQSTGDASPGDFWQNAFDPWGGQHACWSRLVSQAPVVAGVDYRNTILCSQAIP